MKTIGQKAAHSSNEPGKPQATERKQPSPPRKKVAMWGGILLGCAAALLGLGLLLATPQNQNTQSVVAERPTATLWASTSSAPSKAQATATPLQPSFSPDAVLVTVYWTPGGGKYHVTKDCPTLKNSQTIREGSIQDALDAGKTAVCKTCGNATQ